MYLWKDHKKLFRVLKQETSIINQAELRYVLNPYISTTSNEHVLKLGGKFFGFELTLLTQTSKFTPSKLTSTYAEFPIPSHHFPKDPSPILLTNHLDTPPKLIQSTLQPFYSPLLNKANPITISPTFIFNSEA